MHNDDKPKKQAPVSYASSTVEVQNTAIESYDIGIDVDMDVDNVDLDLDYIYCNFSKNKRVTATIAHVMIFFVIVL